MTDNHEGKMNRRHTIRNRVLELLEARFKLENVWHHIQAEFPHNSASWGYIKRIEREWVRQSLPSQHFRS